MTTMNSSAVKLFMITGGAICLLILCAQFSTNFYLHTAHVRLFAKYLYLPGIILPTNISLSNQNTSVRSNSINKSRFTDVENDTDEGYSNGLTVVTAYFNLGSFRKGGWIVWPLWPKTYTSAKYRQWMTVFACIENPLVFYVDNDDDMAFMAKVRSGLPSNVTRIIKLKRNETWSFGLESRITEIFNQSGYPKHHPDTVVPGYSMAMHAKYEVVQRTIRENPFHTKYFSWLDIGLFRKIASPAAVADPTNQKCTKFRMILPLNFSTDSVAYTQVNERNAALTTKDIVYQNHVWLCGCYFVGEGQVLYRWTQEYINATMVMLESNLMSSDQQVLYAMFNTMKPTTKIQTYVGDGRFSYWFHLGYISRTTS